MKALISIAAAAVIASPAGQQPLAKFDHAKHTPLFPSCTTCHEGVASGGATYPDPSFCAACHDGRMQPAVDWRPPTPGSRANLKFAHVSHPGVSAMECTECHAPAGATGVIQRAVVGQCLACHGIKEHQNAALSDCSICHVRPPAPRSHGNEWRVGHRIEAAAAPERCGTCHVRADCLDCHRPAAGSGSPGYHPADFLQRHPAAAYNNESYCTDCHNVGQFCQTCHKQAGLTAQRALGSGYHDAFRGFLAGHGQAARQNLAACVSCHTEADCLRCHVQFNPHGPGFKPQKYQGKNLDMCKACHVGGPPGGS